jgi:hypothetical protein
MTTDLRERLDDLLAGVPPHVHADAATAWRAGAKRRVRRRVVTGGAVGAVLALVGGVGVAAHRVTDPPPADGGGGTRPTATAYPTRIDGPLFRMGDLPDRPGPIAGLVRNNHGWLAVGQHGQVWRMPSANNFDWPSSISPDGTRIAYVDTSAGQSELTLLDLVDGGAFTPDVGGRGLQHSWLIDGPMSWSPDSSRLFVPVSPGTYRGPRVDALLVASSTGAIPVSAPAGTDVEPLGWLSPTRLGWLSWTTDELHPRILITGARGGRVLRSSPAHARIPRNIFTNAVPRPSVDELAAAVEVSTATQQLLISAPGRNGGLVAARAISNDRTLGCPPSWADAYPVVPDTTAPGGYLLWAGPHSYVIQVGPGLRDASCSVWAFDALRGKAYGGVGGWLFDDRDTWLSWHWRQVGLGLGACLLVAIAGLVWWRRRRETRLTA